MKEDTENVIYVQCEECRKKQRQRQLLTNIWVN